MHLSRRPQETVELVFVVSIKKWLVRSVVGRCRNEVDLQRIQKEARVSRISFSVTQAGKIYCLISFQNVGSMNRVLNIGASWFDARSLDISAWNSHMWPIAP